MNKDLRLVVYFVGSIALVCAVGLVILAYRQHTDAASIAALGGGLAATFGALVTLGGLFAARGSRDD